MLDDLADRLPPEYDLEEVRGRVDEVTPYAMVAIQVRRRCRPRLRLGWGMLLLLRLRLRLCARRRVCTSACRVEGRGFLTPSTPSAPPQRPAPGV